MVTPRMSKDTCVAYPALQRSVWQYSDEQVKSLNPGRRLNPVSKPLQMVSSAPSSTFAPQTKLVCSVFVDMKLVPNVKPMKDVTHASSPSPQVLMLAASQAMDLSSLTLSSSLTSLQTWHWSASPPMARTVIIKRANVPFMLDSFPAKIWFVLDDSVCVVLRFW